LLVVLRPESVPLLCEEAVDKEEPELVRWTLIEEVDEATEAVEADVIEERRPEEGVLVF
jgi:hypothetical protein